MSGGRFDYADENAMIEIFGFCDSDNIPNVFEDREISELIYDVFNLIHDFDWYACGDTGKEDYLESKQRFKKKWFGTKRGLRIKRIIDDAIERTRAELYETFGDESRVRWSYDEGNSWRYADIDELIKSYEKDQYESHVGDIYEGEEEQEHE